MRHDFVLTSIAQTLLTIRQSGNLTLYCVPVQITVTKTTLEAPLFPGLHVAPPVLLFSSFLIIGKSRSLSMPITQQPAGWSQRRLYGKGEQYSQNSPIALTTRLP